MSLLLVTKYEVVEDDDEEAEEEEEDADRVEEV